MKLKTMSMLLLCFAVSTASCSKKSSDSTSSGANPVPSMVTIAKESLPATLESTAVSFVGISSTQEEFRDSKDSDLISLTVDTNLTEVKDRIFSPGPTDFLYRLKAVDTRLTELGDTFSDCVDLATTTYTPPAVVTGLNFPMKFGCVVTIDATAMGVSDFKIYFGKADGYYYLAEFQTNASFSTASGNPPSMAVLAKVSEDGTNMEVYQISVENPSSTNYYATVMQILANKTTATFEISTASSADITQTVTPGANFSGLGCGVQLKTDNTLVYASGMFSQAASCPSSATVCASASDLTTTAGCTSPLTTFSTIAMNRAAVSGNNAKTMIIDRTGLPTF